MTPPARRVASIALLLIVAASSARGSPGTIQANIAIEEADSLVRAWVDAKRIPGAVLLVSRDGEVVFERAYGWAQLNEYEDGQYGASAAGESRPSALRRLDHPRAMSAGTAFDLASLTKVMATTFATMLLVDSGELDLDGPVQQYLADFHGGGKEDISPRHLLTHRSGLSQWQPVYYSAAGADQAYAFIRDFPLAWAVGAGRHYSDLGFMILGYAIESITGGSLDAFLQERLYGPLGLESTGFRPGSTAAPATDAIFAADTIFAATSHGNPFEHRMVHDPDFGYRIAGDPQAWNGWRDHTLAGEVNDGNAYHAFGGEAGHAGLFSTAAELSVLLQLLLNRGEYGGHRYISAEVVDTFLAPTGNGQALGWQVPDDLPEGSFEHTGFTGTYVAGIPARGMAIVLLTNRQNLGLDDRGQYPDVSELQRAVARAVVPWR